MESKPGQLDDGNVGSKPGQLNDGGEYEYFSFAEVAELLGGLTRAQVRDAFVKNVGRNKGRISDAGFEYVPDNQRPAKGKAMRRIKQIA